MARKSLLLVDNDPRSLRVLEVSLRKAGYNLATCNDAEGALQTMEMSTPDLILSDTRLPGMDGFELVQTIHANSDWANVPFMFLSSDVSVESKVKGLQLGVEDYLTKPIYIKEIIARINLALQRTERDRFAANRSSMSRTRFTGSLGDMGLVDLLQTIDMSRKSGVLTLRDLEGREGTITFREGQVVDAELGSSRAEASIYRLLLWNEGDFEIDFRPVRVEPTITASTQGLLMEGMRRMDEWGRLCEQVPPLDSILEVVEDELSARLAEIPDEVNGVLRLFDGARSLGEVILDSDAGDDLATLSTISKLYFEGIVQPSGRMRGDGRAVGRQTDVEALLAAAESYGASTESSGEGLVPAPEMPAAESASEASETLATDGEDTRANPDGTTLDVPARADAEPDESPAIPVDGESDSEGTPRADDNHVDLGETSLEAASSPEDEGRAAAELEESTRSDDDSPEIESQSDATPATDQASSGAAETDEEDHAMGKKKRKNRRSASPPAGPSKAPAASEVEETKQEVVAEAAAALKSEEAKEGASNVIQFPAQSKRGVTAVAVNDDVASAGAVDESDEPDEERDDATQQRRLKADEDGDDGDETEASESKPAAPMPGEVKKVDVGDAKKAEKAEPPKPAAKKAKRGRKTDTTSSSEIRAVAATGEHAAVAEDFFTEAKKPGKPVTDDFSDLESSLEPMSKGTRKAMYGTMAILTAGLLVIGGIQFYFGGGVHPEPAALGQHALEMPAPRASREPLVIPPAPTPPTATEAVAPVAAVDPDAIDPGAEAIDPDAIGTEAVDPDAIGTEAIDPDAIEPDAVAAVEPAAVVPEAAAAEPGESYESVMEEARSTRGQRGIPLYERAIELNPAGAEALSQLSFLLLNRGRRGDSARVLELSERATQLDPTDSLAWLVLGAARDAAGDRSAAREAYQACVDQGTGTHVRECRAMVR